MRTVEEEQEEITKNLYRYFENNVEDFGHIIGWRIFNLETGVLHVFWRMKSTNKITSTFVELDLLKE